MSKLEAALAWAAKGPFPVFPLWPGTKKPLIDNWPAVGSRDPMMIMAWWERWPDANIGVVTTNLIVIDIDMKNGKDGLASWQALGMPWPINTLVVKTPTGGYHVYFTGPRVNNSAGRLGLGLDCRGNNGFVLAPGSGLTAIGDYSLVGDHSIAVIPAGLLALLNERPGEFVQSGHGSVGELDSEVNVLRARDHLLDRQPAIEGQGGNQRTYDTACAVKDFGVSEFTCFSLLADCWNDRCEPPWELLDLETIVRNAYHYGQNPPGIKSGEAILAGSAINLPPRTRRNWYDHGAPVPDEVEWLFQGLLPRTGVALIVGPTQAGKTFVAGELSRCLATLKPFFGVYPRDRGGTIFLFAGSEGSGFPKRLAALEEPNPLPIASTQVVDLRTPSTMLDLIEDLKEKMTLMEADFGIPVRVIVLETLSASGLLEDENSNSEAAMLMANLARLSGLLDVLFIVTHHPTKTGSGVRGAGALINSPDFVLEIYRDGRSAVRTIELIKGRDAEQRTVGAFTLLPVEVGQDKEGVPIISMRLSMSSDDVAVKTRTRRSSFMEVVVQAFEFAAIDFGVKLGSAPAVERDYVLEKFRELTPQYNDNTGGRSRAFSAGLRTAVEVGVLEEAAHKGATYITRKEITLE